MSYGYKYVLSLVHSCVLILLSLLYMPTLLNSVSSTIIYLIQSNLLIYKLFIPVAYFILEFNWTLINKNYFLLLNKCMCCSGLVQVGCLFLPKIYIVVFTPEKNTKEVVMGHTRTSSFSTNTVSPTTFPQTDINCKYYNFRFNINCN